MVDAPQYDLNGNATALQGLALVYDEENRLTGAGDQTRQLVFVYDGLGRRVERVEYADGVAVATTRFVYDGWRVVEELDRGYATVRSYTLGLDLSGTFEGAGGIGGLLAFAQPGSGGFTATSYVYDGNGNVMNLLAADGTIAAEYTYSPFGERLTANGPLAEANPYQFSSKPRESLGGLYYYGYRFYAPTVGRWLSTDPIEEQGAVNLYGFVANNPLNASDPLGLATIVAGNGQNLINTITDFFDGGASNTWIFNYPHPVAGRFQNDRGTKWIWDFFRDDLQTYWNFTEEGGWEDGS